jgi:predicted metal-dependent phosphoesterase TrpH
LANLERIAPLVDAVEVFNSRCLLPIFNKKAEAFAKEHCLLKTAGSDVHTLREVGWARMVMPEFEDAVSFREALREVRIEGRRSGLGVKVSSRWAVIKKMISR